MSATVCDQERILQPRRRGDGPTTVLGRVTPCDHLGQVGPVAMTTNGTRNGTDTASPGHVDEASSSLNGQSVEERLEALLETIRTWDWRAGVVEVGPSPTDIAATTAPPLTTTTFTEAHEHTETHVREPSPLQGAADTQPLVIQPTHRSVGVAPPTEALTLPATTVTRRTEALAPSARTIEPQEEAADAAVETDDPAVRVAPPLAIDPSLGGTHGDVGVDGTSSLGRDAEPRPEPDGRLRRVWSHRMTKLAVLGLAALVVVVSVIGGIRLWPRTRARPGRPRRP